LDGCKAFTIIKKNKCSSNTLGGEQINKTQDELQWIVAQRLLSALTIPGFK
jgi:acyl CoA:acetate/3-ketoacid CoA transferase beta subunit